MTTRALLAWGIGSASAAVLLGALIVLGYAEPPGLDRWWNEVLTAAPTDWLLTAALALDTVGGGWVAVFLVPGLVLLALAIARRWRAAVFAAAAFIASAALVQLLKNLFARARPEDMVVASDFGSFPSGHTANAATIALVLALLFPRVWVWIAGAAWVLAMALSRTLLSVHWVSDTVGGGLVGAAAVLLLAAWLLPWARRRAGGPGVDAVRT